MSHAVTSMKNNRALLKNKRSFRDVRNLYQTQLKKTSVDFKQVSPTELARVRKKIIAKAKKEGLKEIGIYILSFLLTISILFAIWKLL